MEFLLFILILIVLSAIVSFGLAIFIRSNLLCIIASIMICELLTTLFGLLQAAQSHDGYDALLGVNITIIIDIPIFIGTVIVFTFLARRIYQKRKFPTDS